MRRRWTIPFLVLAVVLGFGWEVHRLRHPWGAPWQRCGGPPFRGWDLDRSLAPTEPPPPAPAPR